MFSRGSGFGAPTGNNATTGKILAEKALPAELTPATIAAGKTLRCFLSSVAAKRTALKSLLMTPVLTPSSPQSLDAVSAAVSDAEAFLREVRTLHWTLMKAWPRMFSRRDACDAIHLLKAAAPRFKLIAALEKNLNALATVTATNPMTSTKITPQHVFLSRYVNFDDGVKTRDAIAAVLTDFIKLCCAIIDLSTDYNSGSVVNTLPSRIAEKTISSTSSSPSSSGGNVVVHLPVLLNALQVFIALSDSVPVAQSVEGLVKESMPVFLVRVLQVGKASFRRAAFRSVSSTTSSSFRVLLFRIRSGEQSLTTVKNASHQQETLIIDALWKVIWRVLTACAVPPPAPPQAAQRRASNWDAWMGEVAGSTLTLVMTIRGLRCKAIMQSSPVALATSNNPTATLRLRILTLQWLVSPPWHRVWLSANEAGLVFVNVLGMQLQGIGLLMDQEAGGTTSISDAELEGWMRWWWESCVVGSFEEELQQQSGGPQSKTAPSAALIKDRQSTLIRFISRETQAAEQLQLLWSDKRIAARLCLPPGSFDTTDTAATSVESTSTSSTQKKKDKKESGFFAELRRMASSSKSGADPVNTAPWKSDSLLRKRSIAEDGPSPADTGDSSSVSKLIASFITTFDPPLWMRGATLLALLSVDSLAPLHGLSFHGPRPVHKLLSCCIHGSVLPTTLDVLYAADLPATKDLGTLMLQTTGRSSLFELVQCTVRPMTMVAHGCLSLLVQWCNHLMMVTGDHELATSACPLPFERIHVLIDLVNVILLEFCKRLLLNTSSVLTVTPSMSGGLGIASAKDLFRNSLTDRWMREDPFRLRNGMLMVVRSFIDRSLRIPHLTQISNNPRLKTSEALSDLTLWDERFWFLDRDRQESLFPGSYRVGEKKELKCNWNGLQVAVIQSMPHVVPFVLRIEYFNRLLADDRKKFCGDSNVKLGLRIRRDHLLEDAMEQLSQVRANNSAMSAEGKYLRVKWHVQFVDVHGQLEAGIDAGGLLKEFMEKLIVESFHPNVGLFVPIRVADESADVAVTGTSDRVLHPNPHARALFAADHPGNPTAYLGYFHSLGLFVAKAIYEGIVLNLELAPSFLNNILGRGNSIDDLKEVDAQQFHSLKLLSEMENVEEAEVYFCVDEESLGTTNTVDLVPDGRNIRVTNENVVRYVHLVAHHLLVKRNREETNAFASGFFEIIPKTATTFLFHRRELQQLISGRNGLRLDVNDLKEHCRLMGVVEQGSRTLSLLWEVLDEMSVEDQGRFLQFCTGSSKPPLLGFAFMQPPFSIRGIDEGTVFNFLVDIDRLPSASTCFNLLKLPLYRNKNNLKEKLLQAIRADSGFQLS